ncbi:MAG: class I SAM-dependent methyltransferase [Candidatus Limnocylindria bacterium]
MTLRGPSAREAFRDADAYADTMAPSLRSMASGVVFRAALTQGERVLDVGTGTGIGVAAARGSGCDVIGLDVSPEMLAVARRDLPDHEFIEADFSAMPFEPASFDVILSVHALLFADDPVAALREWRRVTRPGGRLSLSVPGPSERTPWSIYQDVYERHGIRTARATDYPTQAILREWASAAGWSSIASDADPRTAIRLSGTEQFDRWLSVGSRGAALRGRVDSDRRALADDLLAVTPREPDGTLRIPFGTLYLTARS